MAVAVAVAVEEQCGDCQGGGQRVQMGSAGQVDGGDGVRGQQREYQGGPSGVPTAGQQPRGERDERHDREHGDEPQHDDGTERPGTGQRVADRGRRLLDENGRAPIGSVGVTPARVDRGHEGFHLWTQRA
ncbi:hypothetical protein BL254_02400 [Protofrankia sp. BMG5.30]|nr:hypothetical protein BL254_02400 [Protofrankia sp. BMG5.30]